MNFILFLLFLSLLLFAKINARIKILISDQTLPNSICKVTNEIINSKSDTQDILVGNLGGKVWSSMVNNIIKCIDVESAVVITDFNLKITEERLWKATVVILVGLKQTDDNDFFKIITYSQPPSVYLHTSKVICVVPTTSPQSQRVKTLGKFVNFGFLNIALVYKEPKGAVIYEIINAQRTSLEMLSNPVESDWVFPDKLKNLAGFQYEIAVLDQPPSVIANGSFVSSHLLYFLRALKNIQKASFKINFLGNITTLADHWRRRKFHLCLNSATVLISRDLKLMTYGTKCHCALIPIPPTTSRFQLVIIKPFDSIIWFYCGLSVAGSAAVWWMFRGRGAVDSHWQLAVGICMMFIGQGADFSRHNRFVLAVLLNIICLSVFLLSNLYEGIVTSALIEPGYENRLKTVDDLLASNYEIRSTDAFAYQYKNSSLFESLAPRLNYSDTFLTDEDIIKHRHVFIRLCDEAERILRTQVDDKLVSDFYYTLPEPLTQEFIRLEASYLNPFLDRFQHYMDLSFQAGLPGIWKVFEKQDFSRQFSSENHDENEFLMLKDLESVFHILFFGYSLSCIVVIAEIFCHDCLMNLSINNILMSIIIKVKKLICKANRDESLKVRKVHVQPHLNVD